MATSQNISRKISHALAGARAKLKLALVIEGLTFLLPAVALGPRRVGVVQHRELPPVADHVGVVAVPHVVRAFAGVARHHRVGAVPHAWKKGQHSPGGWEH